MTNLEWLEERPRFSDLRYNLFRVYTLLTHFVPQWRQLQPIIITGSNGKGTAAVTCAEILRQGGFVTGLCTSPHLLRVGERINLNQGDIDDSTLKSVLGDIRGAMPPETHGAYLHSEILLTAALMWFREHQARYIVLEAGLGGRLDSVNIFRAPLATAVTSVSLEHAAILGPDIPAIAREKAGIVKKCRPVVTAASSEALPVLGARAKLLNAPLHVYGRDFGWQGDYLSLGKTKVWIPNLEDTPAGKVNRAIGAMLAHLAAPDLSEDALVTGVASARLAGRFQVLSGKPIRIIDVAHNAEGMENLVKALDARYPFHKKAYVLGIFADKPVQQMVDIAAKSGEVFYAPPVNPRAFIPQGNLEHCLVLSDLKKAYFAALNSQADIICVSGSFATVSELFSLLSG